LPSPLVPHALSTKPDLEDAARRWAAFLAGDLIDRPIVMVTAPWPDAPRAAEITYRDQQFGDIDALLDQVIAGAVGTYHGGEDVPSFAPNFGPDMIAVLCGGQFRWSAGSDYTCWAEPIVQDWRETLPFGLQHDHPLWLRMLRFYERAAQRLEGIALLREPDLVTNLDLLAGLRGPERLCADLLDQPEVIDEAMACARAVFRDLWSTVVRVGKLDERGYYHALYAPDGAALLQCDFSYLISPALCRSHTSGTATISTCTSACRRAARPSRSGASPQRCNASTAICAPS